MDGMQFESGDTPNIQINSQIGICTTSYGRRSIDQGGCVARDSTRGVFRVTAIYWRGGIKDLMSEWFNPS